MLSKKFHRVNINQRNPNSFNSVQGWGVHFYFLIASIVVVLESVLTSDNSYVHIINRS